MLRLFQELDALLRGERTRPQRLADSGLDAHVGRLAVVIVVLCLLYGACMGTFSLLKDPAPTTASSDRYLQWIASALKTPALFFLTLVITFPSLYVFNALVGSQLKIARLIQLLVASLAVNGAVLASLGPIVAFFSMSTNNYPFIKLLNVAAFGVAGLLGLLFLLQTLHRISFAAIDAKTRGDSLPASFPGSVEAETLPESTAPAETLDRPVIEEATLTSPLDMPSGQVLAGHTRSVFRCWIVLFAVVGAQLGWVLRPFVGDPSLPFSWFRARRSNFFLDVLHSLWALFTSN